MENTALVIVPIQSQQKTNTSSGKTIKNEMPVNCRFERTPECDCFNPEPELYAGANCMKALKMPNPSELVKEIAVIPVVLETGKQILIGIFDIRDIWNERSDTNNN